MTKAAELALLFAEVRRLFHALRAAADELHAGREISAAMRGVMESLARGGPRSVPDLARERPVSRQHIQTIVDALLQAGHVELHENPAHKKSRLVALSRRGAALFAEMMAAETAFLRKVTARMGTSDPAAVRLVLAGLRDIVLRQTNLQGAHEHAD